MKNKSFLNKIEELKPNIPVQLDVERKLVPRLKFMGYVMCFFCIASLIFEIVVPEDIVISAEIEHENFAGASIPGLPLDNDEDVLEFTAKEVLNFYVISLIFASIGAACFLTAWKKKKTLFYEQETSKE